MVTADINNLRYFLVQIDKTKKDKYKISFPVPKYGQKNTFDVDKIPDWVEEKITYLILMSDQRNNSNINSCRDKMPCGSFWTEYGYYILNDNIK